MTPPPLRSPAASPDGRPERPSPPRLEERDFLRWVYLGRLAVAAAAFLAVAFDWEGAPPEVSLVVSVLALLALAFTAGSFWYTHLARRPLHRTLLYLQLVFDVVLVTVLVHLTGGSASVFASLYILVIVAGAVLLPFHGGVLIALLAAIVYLASILWSPDAVLDIAVSLHLVLFVVVAVVTGLLAERLDLAGVSLGEVETELERLRVGTDEILQTIQTGLLSVDAEGRLAYMNPAAERLLELRQEDWIDVPILDELDRRAPGLGELIRHSVQERRGISGFETRAIRVGIGILGGGTTVNQRREDEITVTAIFQDITEKRRGEVIRRRADRLEAVAELSASLAHEIRNPLASIRSAVEQLSGDALDQEDRQILRRLVVNESTRLSRLLSEFLEFARLDTGEMEPVAVERVAEEVVSLVRQHPDTHDRGVTVEAVLPDHTCLVRGDADLLHRALFNLLINAVQWAGEGGRARLEVGPFRREVYGQANGDTVVRVRIQDSGPGIPDEAQEGIFSPFFTTREGGTGLGLAMVHRAIEAHNGAVLVESGQNGDYPGATFELFIPLLTQSPATT
jgi:two-component system, NtrC family, sensor histidine kinase PilS